MTVIVLDPKDIPSSSKGLEGTGPPVFRNFFDVFGTTGCQLNCNDERILDADLYEEKTRAAAKTRKEKKKITFERKTQINHFRESRKTWFDTTEIKASAEQGCNSCNILLKILVALFFRNINDLPEGYEYSIAQDFEVKYRRHGEEEPIAIVQLFQPPGKQQTTNKQIALI
jgi:hypothetical protein